MKYIEAISKAVREEMIQDGNIILMGQDIKLWGGSSGAFKGLDSDFPGRVFNTPISEMATASMAVGMAMNGIRPIVEYTFIDFALHAMDQIINQAAKVKFLSNGQFTAPVISRVVINNGRGYGATHSQSLESMFAQVPGLNVVYPSTPNDAYHLMKFALNSQNPTVFVEHKLLHNLEGNVASTYGQPIYEKSPTSVVRHPGDKLTLISYGRMLQPALEAAKKVGGVEVIDLLSLNPIGYESIESSVRRTGKILMLEEGYGWISGEVLAHILENFSQKKIVAKRLFTKREPITASYDEEIKDIPSVGKIVKTIKEMVG